MGEVVIIDGLAEREVEPKLEFQYITGTNEEDQIEPQQRRFTELNTCKCYNKDMKGTVLRSGGGGNECIMFQVC